jgi:DNA primase
MLRAAKVAAGRKLELRVVPLPEGRDPAEVALDEGADAVRGLVAKSVPFIRFRVERTLRVGDLSSPEGKDQAIAELRPAFATIGPSILQEELIAMVADRLDIASDLARRLLYGGTGRGAPAPVPRAGGGAGAVGRGAERPPAAAPISRSARAERGFLALCTKLPDEGARALADMDPQLHFTDQPSRQAAAWLKHNAAAPLDGLEDRDDELASVMREIVGRAASIGDVRPAVIEVERLRLELALVERQLRARGDLPRTDLAHRRGELRSLIDHAMERSMG